MSRIVLAMSGGVDSSVAAWLLQRAGHDVIGVFMRHGEVLGESVGACATAGACSTAGAASQKTSLLPVISSAPGHKQGCCSASDAEDARRVADRLGIPFYALDFSDAFGWIMDYFVAEYSAARTPNPCVMCNNWVKFGKLFEYADSVGAEFIATGHYARLVTEDIGCGRSPDIGCDRSPDRVTPGCDPSPNVGSGPSPNLSSGRSPDRATSPVKLLRGLDETKDQSYVLFGLGRDVLSRVMLPVGGFRKEQIRAMAAEIGLRVADKRDSQEICFVTSGHHAEFVRARRQRDGDDLDTSGEIVTTDGRVVGTHAGLEGYTIGQRKGLGVALGEPWFVVRLEPNTRRVVLGKREELARTTLTADRCNWLIDPPTAPFRCHAKIRYNTPAASATATALDDNRLHVQFDEPAHGVAPGQAVVCYDNDRVLGGGWIVESR